MKEKEKKFIVPEASIIAFTNEDIITSSGEGKLNWSEDDNGETF